jgi:hypothetical protein
MSAAALSYLTNPTHLGVPVHSPSTPKRNRRSHSSQKRSPRSRKQRLCHSLALCSRSRTYRTDHLRNLLQNSIWTRTITHRDMPPLLKTYFNPHHRSFLSTLFTATFLGSVLVVAFPCPVRPKDGLSSLANESATPVTQASVQGREEGVGKPVRNGRVRDEIVVMMNERSGKRRFLAED